MSAREDIAYLLWQIVPSEDDSKAKENAGRMLDAHRSEVLAEVTTWLIKKAREFHASRRKQEREQGDTCAVLASKIARGAVRANNTLMLPNAGFFEVDHTYAEPGDTTDWRFRCDAITTHPGTGERIALGWRHFRGEWTECAYGEDDWEIHRLTGVTEAGAS
jgi:hypothetical protein